MTIRNSLLRKNLPKIFIAIFFFAITMEVGRAARSNSIADPIPPGTSNQTNKARLQETYGKLPLSFEANRGQADTEVKFLSRGNGYSLFLTPNEAVLALKKGEALKKVEAKVEGTKNPLAPVSGGEGKGEGEVLRMKLFGANPNPDVVGLDQLPGKSNYFIGKDPSKCRTNVPTYTKVEYKNVYPGVDLVYYGNQRQLEYDFVVAPGEDPNKIVFGFDGAEKVEIDGQGDLVLQADDSEIRMKKPYIYQEIEGKRVEVDGKFKIQDVFASNQRERGNLKDGIASPSVRNDESESARNYRNMKFIYGFEVASYDASKPLIIDPVPAYSTYLGGSSFDQGTSIAVDAAGNAYVTGITNSANFHTTPGAFQTTFGGADSDAFIAKISDAPPVIEVAIDIKPGSFPNSINLGSNGTVPVAIFSDTAFDATTVDPSTITLASAPVKLKGNGTLMSSFQDVNNDGIMDLVVHVSTQALQLTNIDTEAQVEGQTFDGTAITGSDSVRVVH